MRAGDLPRRPAALEAELEGSPPPTESSVQAPPAVGHEVRSGDGQRDTPLLAWLASVTPEPPALADVRMACAQESWPPSRQAPPPNIPTLHGPAGRSGSDPVYLPCKEKIKPASSFSRRGQATRRLFAKSKSFLKEPQKLSQCPSTLREVWLGGGDLKPLPSPSRTPASAGIPLRLPSSVGPWVGAPGPAHLVHTSQGLGPFRQARSPVGAEASHKKLLLKIIFIFLD